MKKAMVLCAGLGTRLLPVTQATPKPLVPVLNIPNILYTIRMLRNLGVREIILNLYHLGDQIEGLLGDGEKWGVRITYSRETTLLGTGGGLKKAEPFFDGEPFLLCNCDFIANMDLRPILKRHHEKKAVATMVLIEDEKRQPLYSRVGANTNGNLVLLSDSTMETPSRVGIFTGIHILEPGVFTYLKEGPSGITQSLYGRLMGEKPNLAFVEFADKSGWFDTGDLDAYWKSSMDLMDNLGNPLVQRMLIDHGYEEIRAGIWTTGPLPSSASLASKISLAPPVILGEKCRISGRVTIGPSVILGDRCEIGEYSRSQQSVVLPDAVVASAQTLRNVVLFDRAVLRPKPEK